MPKTAARALLTDFLKSRRARLDPELMGIAERGSRRRSAGLRRSEVATLAGISTEWYTLFEMGRERAMTVRVIEPVANALRLSKDERDYVYDLVRGEPPPPAPIEITASIARSMAMIDDIMIGVYDRWHTPVAWNAATEAFFSVSDTSRLRTNRLWRQFFNKDLRNMFAEDEWTESVRSSVGIFRRALGRDPQNPEALAILTALRESPTFCAMWNEHEVRSFDSEAVRSGQKVYRVHHPTYGRLEYYFLLIQAPAAAGGYFGIVTPHRDADRHVIATATAVHIAKGQGLRLYRAATLRDAV